MTSRKVIPGLKDSTGAFVPNYMAQDNSERRELDKIDPLPPPMMPKDQIIVDDLMIQGLACIYEALRRVRSSVRAGSMSRTDISNLKDIMSMLHNLKKVGQEELENMSDEELERKAASGSNTR